MRLLIICVAIILLSGCSQFMKKVERQQEIQENDRLVCRPADSVLCSGFEVSD